MVFCFWDQGVKRPSSVPSEDNLTQSDLSKPSQPPQLIENIFSLFHQQRPTQLLSSRWWRLVSWKWFSRDKAAWISCGQKRTQIQNKIETVSDCEVLKSWVVTASCFDEVVVMIKHTLDMNFEGSEFASDSEIKTMFTLSRLNSLNASFSLRPE